MTEPPADRYRYFRIEARELLEAFGRGVLELEKAPGDRAIVARLLRHAHTLKGAARIVQQPAIGDLAHAIEETLGTHRDPTSPQIPRERIDELLRSVDAIAAAVAALDPSRPALPASDHRPLIGDDVVQTVRADIGEIDALHAGLVEAGVQATALRTQLSRLEHAGDVARILSEQLHARRPDGDGAPAWAVRLGPLADDLQRALAEARRLLGIGVDQTEREIVQVRDAADRLRLVPASSVFGALERTVRDAARAMDRRVEFRGVGGDVRLDGTVLAMLRDALQHIARNAVTHGIEAPVERQRCGKPLAGTVRLHVQRRGNRVIFSCHDDGRGIDTHAVRTAAIRKGMLTDTAAASASAADLTALLLRGGLSTVGQVTEISGRGVGLDVVRDTGARLKAHVAIRTEQGAGTTVEIAVPVSLASMHALHVEAGGAIVSLPLDTVKETLLVTADRVVPTERGRAISHDGEVVPFLPLARALGAVASDARQRCSVIIVEAEHGSAALGADRLVDVSEIVVRPLPAFVVVDPVVMGASLDAEGNPRLVLDADGLVAAAAAGGEPDLSPQVGRLPILVVDDSLTTRMLEQSILESAGYEVEVAASAEEALERCAARRFGLFIVDIEMPGMDGLEFVRTTRADARLRDVPAMLVTSRTSEEDRRRGAAVGAVRYIVKSEFDQEQLLTAIRGVLG